MKNWNKYLLGTVGSLFLWCSCEDLLREDPTSYYDKDDFFVSESKAEMAVMGVYTTLADMYAEREMALPCSDDTYYYRNLETDNARADLSHYILTSQNTYVENEWNTIYGGLNDANFTIENIEAMPAYETDRDLHRLVGETKFLRALLSFNLVRYWGDVPYRTTSTKNREDAYVARVSRELIYDQMVADLDSAKMLLSWADAGATPERATQGAARALLMRVLLQRAGYSLQLDGTLTRPDDAVRQLYFERVVAEWEAFEAEGFHDFYDGTYEEFFRCFCNGTLDPTESLFEVAYSSASDGVAGSWGEYIGQTVGQPESGLPESIESQTMKYTQAFYRVVPDWQNFFEADDERRDIMVCTTSMTWNRDLDVFEERNVTRSQDWTPGKWRRVWMPISYSKNKNGTNFCYIRYADVVLMAAEAYNELGNTAEAWRLLNLVRERAGATRVADGSDPNYRTFYKDRVWQLDFIDDSDEQGKFRTALYWERGFELAFEGQRKYDLVRWGILGDALRMARANTELDDVYFAGGFNFQDGKHELMPIPLDELLINTKLNGINNPGY